MTEYFQGTDTLYSITEKYPETIAVFVSKGFSQMEDPVQRELFGKMINLETALKMKNINLQMFVSLLNEVISLERNNSDSTLVTSVQKDENRLFVAGLLPCPVRIPLLEQYNSFVEKIGLTGINTELKAASVGTQWVADNLDGVSNPEELPDLFMSAGFDLFFDLQKIGRFREQGVFADLVNYNGRENPLFAGRDLQDPSGNYSVISVVPAIFLVNTAELDGRDVPCSWEDLLAPQWEQSVSLPVGDFDLFNAILLNIHDRYGDDGIKKLGRSMLHAMHPAQMIKSNRLKQKRSAITIMPYFFTKTARQNSSMKAVWPEDGAIISPIFMLAKKERAVELQLIVDFFASRQVGEILSHHGLFPSLHPDVDNRLPDDAPMMWLGWSKILSTDLTTEIARCEELFNSSLGDEE